MLGRKPHALRGGQHAHPLAALLGQRQCNVVLRAAFQQRAGQVAARGDDQAVDAAHGPGAHQPARAAGFQRGAVDAQLQVRLGHQQRLALGGLGRLFGL